MLARGKVMADARPGDLAQRSGREPYILEARPRGSAAELLAAVKGVAGVGEARVETLEDGWCRVSVVPGAGAPDLRERLGAAAGAVAVVRELTRERPSLERAFLNMIGGDAGGGGVNP
jgi:hypothetical protein